MGVPASSYVSEVDLLKDEIKVVFRSVKRDSRENDTGNTDVRKEFKIFPVNDKLREYRLQWLSNVDRGEDICISKMGVRYRPKGKRRVEQPRTRWEVESEQAI